MLDNGWWAQLVQNIRQRPWQLTCRVCPGTHVNVLEPEGHGKLSQHEAPHRPHGGSEAERTKLSLRQAAVPAQQAVTQVAYLWAVLLQRLHLHRVLW